MQLSKTFLVMGGIDGDNEILDTIFEFDTVNWGWITRYATITSVNLGKVGNARVFGHRYIRNCNFLRDQRLAKGRRYFAAMALPDEWEACTY